MKKNFMTRVLAVALSAAMALSMATATNLTVAEAASKPAMKTSSFKVRIGNKAKNYYASAATQKAYKIVKAKAGNTDKATAKVVKSGKAVAITAGSKTGKTTIKLTFKNKKTAAKKTLKFSGKVLAAKTAAQAITEIKQTAADTIEVTFATAPAEVAAANFAVTRESVNSSTQTVVVKAAKADAKDAKKVTVTLYGKLTDAAVYDVAYTASEKTVTGKFTATDGTVAKIDVTPTTVTAGKDTVLYYSVYDANDILLDKQKIDAAVDSKIEVLQKTSTGGGYLTGNKIYLPNVGDTMEVTATYHSYKYEGATEVGAVTNTVTITAVANAAKVSAVPYTISKFAVWNWDTLTPSTTIAMGDEGYALRMLVLNDDGSAITSDDEYTVESSDTSVFIVNGNAAVANALTPVGIGSAYAVIKDIKGNVVYSVPVTVVASRVLTKVELTNTALKTSTNSSINTDIATDSTAVTCYDQYGARMTVGTQVDLAVALKTVPDGEKTDKTSIKSAMIDDSVAGVYSVKRTNFNTSYKYGPYSYVVTATDIKTGASRQAAFTVSLNKLSDTSDSYALVLTDTTTKATVTQASAGLDSSIYGTTEQLTVHVVSKNNGVIKEQSASSVTIGSITLKKNGAAIAKTGRSITTPMTCAAVDTTEFLGAVEDYDDISAGIMNINVVAKSGSKYFKNLEAGNYTVEALIYTVDSKNKPVTSTLSTAFKVVDTDPTVTVTVNKTKVDNHTIGYDDEKVFSYAYDGVSLALPDGTVNKGYVKGNDVTGLPTYVKGYKTSDVYVQTDHTLVVKKMFVTVALPNRADTTSVVCTPGTKEVTFAVTKGTSFLDSDNTGSWTL